MEKKIWWEHYHAGDREILLQAIGQDLQREQGIQDVQRFVTEANERERLGSTVVAPHLAIPHVCSININKAMIIFIKLAEPVTDWDEDHHSIERLILTILPQPIPPAAQKQCEHFFASLGRHSVLQMANEGNREEISKLMKEKK